MIDKKKRLAFVKIPRTAGSSIRTYFFMPYGFKMKKWDNDIIVNLNGSAWRSVEGWHVEACRIKKYLGDEYDDYLKFAVIRNPWDRMLSIYSWQKKKKSFIQLRDFIKGVRKGKYGIQAQYHSAQMTKWVCEGKNVIIDNLIRYENLEEEFKAFCKANDLGDGVLQHVNKSIHKPYRKAYDAKTRELVEEMFQDDIRLFGYSF